MKYIAYGSNLNIEQMKYRCPTARPAGVGKINDYSLVFRGSKSGNYATIIREKGKSVPVAIWDITEDDEHYLDAYEGFPIFYHKEKIIVQTDHGQTSGMAYVMNENAIPGKPSDTYVIACLKGYDDFNFDKKTFIRFMADNH